MKERGLGDSCGYVGPLVQLAKFLASSGLFCSNFEFGSSCHLQSCTPWTHLGFSFGRVDLSYNEREVPVGTLGLPFLKSWS